MHPNELDDFSALLNTSLKVFLNTAFGAAAALSVVPILRETWLLLCVCLYYTLPTDCTTTPWRDKPSTAVVGTSRPPGFHKRLTKKGVMFGE